MCFSPQRRAIFRHRHFQNRSEIVVFCAFWLANVLFATAACNFWCHLSAPTSAPAALTGLLLDWPDTRIYEKTQHFVTSLTFGADVSSFLLTFWLLHLLSTDLTTLLLLFNSPYCRKFLFKLPSTNTSMFHTYEFMFLANMPATSYSPMIPSPFTTPFKLFRSIREECSNHLLTRWSGHLFVVFHSPSSSAQPRLGNGWRRPWCHRDWDVEVAHRLQTIWSVTPWRCGVAGADLADLSSAGCADRS